MQEIDGKWIMCGVDWDDPECIHTINQAIEYIKEVGFLPLFAGDIPGFSLEERTAAECWWCEDPNRDPWMWREVIARSKDIAYGKFFGKKAGFITKEWLPYFVNFRRDGYDFDALWDDEKASLRQKKIMDLFDNEPVFFSYEIKQNAGFGKGGEKNFEGTVTQLQMQMYLCACDFKKRVNKSGKEYGWNVTIYSTLEHLWGYDYVTSKYVESPSTSYDTIVNHIKEIYPIATEKQIRKLLK